jgi:N-acetylneuraminic acid mutarotase
MKTPRIFKKLLFVILALITNSIAISQTLNTWTSLDIFDGSARNGAFTFTINGKAYLGSGFNSTPLKDFWRYNPQNDTWTQLKDASALPRHDAIGFAIDGKGYMGTGDLGNLVQANDFYEYDPATDLWSLKSAVSGGPRRDAVAFVIGNKGYVMGGWKGRRHLTRAIQ